MKKTLVTAIKTKVAFKRACWRTKDIPMLVDFYADWCGPCHMIAPFIEELAVEYKDVLRVCKVDTERDGGISQALEIDAIPTLMIFCGGASKPAARVCGAAPKAKIKAWIEKTLAARRAVGASRRRA